MAEDISLVKPDGQEWGFRVTGGVDFGTPLAIVKINKGSTAERYGLRVGDMIVAVNDQPLGHMTHFQATDTISKAGNFFKVSVIRGSIVEIPRLPLPQITIQSETEVNSEIITNDVAKSPMEQGDVELPTVLANMINSGLKEQEEMTGDDQQNTDVDAEVAGSWNFSLPQQLVVTLKSVSPSLAGRPGSPWQIIEEYSTFVDSPDDSSNKPLEITTEINVTATENTQDEKVAMSGGLEHEARVEVTEGEPRQGEMPAGDAVPEEARKELGSSGTPSGQQVKNEGQGTTEQPAEEHKEYTEDEIAEMMSGCAEVIAGKCMGVDFQKLPPDSDIMKSEVLHALIAERIEYPKKKLSTFQQRPSRPVPKPKGEPEMPMEPYLPLKYKGNKNEAGATQAMSPAAVEGSEANQGDETETQQNHEDDHTQEHGEGEDTHVHEEGGEDMAAHESAEDADHTDAAESHEEVQPTPELEPPTVVNSSDIEAQLAEIQSQLAAIIQLPVEIQQHLSFIQTQLSKVLEMRAAAEAKETQEHHEEEGVYEEGDHEEGVEGEEHEQEVEGEHPPAEEEREMGEEHEGDEQLEVESEAQPVEPEPEPEPEPPKHKKDIQWQKEDETQQKNKPFFPLTPQPRPVQLPGGRHWFKSRDVYTEDFIAETISGKEEVIVGTTIGVDFRKFQYSLDHLKNSSVYKMIHGDEQKRAPGEFASRAEKVLAKEDYVNPCEQKG